MAFDLWLDNHRVPIEEHEEVIFSRVDIDRKSFPALSLIWHDFYGSPVIESSTANIIVHELISILAIESNIPKPNIVIINTINKLLPIFSSAYIQGKSIQGAGD